MLVDLIHELKTEGQRFCDVERPDAYLQRSNVCGPGSVRSTDQRLIGHLKSWFFAATFAMPAEANI